MADSFSSKRACLHQAFVFIQQSMMSSGAKEQQRGRVNYVGRVQVLEQLQRFVIVSMLSQPAAVEQAEVVAHERLRLFGRQPLETRRRRGHSQSTTQRYQFACRFFHSGNRRRYVVQWFRAVRYRFLGRPELVEFLLNGRIQAAARQPLLDRAAHLYVAKHGPGGRFGQFVGGPDDGRDQQDAGDQAHAQRQIAVRLPAMSIQDGRFRVPHGMGHHLWPPLFAC